jgi:hypothetical protein
MPENFLYLSFDADYFDFGLMEKNEINKKVSVKI